MNCYLYSPTNFEWCPKHITLDNGDEKKNIIDSIISYTPIEFKKSFDWINEIIELFNFNNLYIGVDLYYWLPNSNAWGKRHDCHNSLLTNYDVNKDVFTILDDDLSGFNTHQVSRKQLEIAVSNADLNVDGYIVNCLEPDDYLINYDEIVNNSKLIIKNLSSFLIHNDYWLISTSDIGDNFNEFYAFELFKIINRQIANIMLFDRLYQLNFIDAELKDKACIILNDIKNGWSIIKNKLLKLYIKTEKNDVRQLNQYKNELIEKEINVWLMLEN